jgi:hypothetical protein
MSVTGQRVLKIERVSGRLHAIGRVGSVEPVVTPFGASTHMWRFALLGLCLGLTGCGFQTWGQPPFVAGQDPYLPSGTSETMRRAMGLPVSSQPLTPEPGNVWPGPGQTTTEPTLKQLEQVGTQLPNAAPPPALPSEQGSSTPPGRSTAVPVPQIPPVPPAATPAPPPVAGVPPAVVQTPTGPGVTSNAGSGYQQITLPNGTTAIVVPNGNGTSTVIRSDGTVQTIPTPK